MRLATPTDWAVEVVEAAPSTNAVVADRAREGAGEGLVVVAEHQTAGRGRLDRTWETPARAALTFSVLLRPSATAVDWPWLPLLTGYAAGRALRSSGRRVSLKWPNDVLLADRKVAGILVERVDTPAGPAAVVGIGINVDQTRDELPLDAATSLALEGADIDRTDLLTALLRSLRTEYDAFQRGERRVRCARRTPTPARRSAAPCGSTCPPARPSRARRPAIDAPGGRLVVARPTAARDAAVGAGDVVPRPRRPSQPTSSPGDMIAAWPSRRSCSTRVSTSSSPPAPTPRRCCSRCWPSCILVALAIFLDKSIDDTNVGYGVWVVVILVLLVVLVWPFLNWLTATYTFTNGG